MSDDQKSYLLSNKRGPPVHFLNPFTLKKKKRSEGKILFRITVSTNALPGSQENIQEGKQNIHIVQSSPKTKMSTICKSYRVINTKYYGNGETKLKTCVFHSLLTNQLMYFKHTVC